MFPAAALPLAKKLHVVVAVIPLRVPAAIQSEAATAAATDVECITHEQHPHRFTHRDVQNLLLCDLAVRDRQPRNGLAILSSEQQPSFGIFREADP